MSNHTHQPPCVSPGNPVFSCMLKSSPHTLTEEKSHKLLFKTTSSEYGARFPNFESSPCSYHPISQTFSQQLGLCGMFQDHSFNTSMDHSHLYIPNYKDLLHKD
ncbi:hypothetical protein DNTS_033332 [Danionella cerebrum]|uniref:Uncharacterized protein n=1 Tax=Danionella cerebrum TaxID=2873325 RepID=A0A553QJN1_9TELE|nr:hypothetical protein DNTS_033332 [Danionella translucida]